MEGPIAWITSGKVDAVLDIRFPRAKDEAGLNEILGEIADAISTSISTVNDPTLDRIPGQRQLARPALSPPESKPRENVLPVIVDIDLRFRDLKAVVPLFTQDISYVSGAVIRPIVAFMK